MYYYLLLGPTAGSRPTISTSMYYQLLLGSSGYQPNWNMPTPQISQLWPKLTISVKFDNSIQIWQFQPNRDRPGEIRTVQVTPGIPEIPGNLKYLDLGQSRNFCDVSYYSLQFAALALTLCIYIKYDVINDLCIICTALHIIFVKCIFSTSLQWVNLWSASG